MNQGARPDRRMPAARGMRRATAICVATLAACLVWIAPASAHSQIISTSPIDGAVLDGPPTEVRLVFDAPLLDETDTMSINDADGNVISSLHPTPQGAEVAIPWPAGTKPGVYQVAYRVVCGDGHPEIGALRVTITGDGSGTAVTAAVASAPASSGTASSGTASSSAAAAAPASGLPIAVLGIAILAAGAVVGAAVLVLRRKPSPTE